MPGTISAPWYQSDVTSLRFSWADFEADMEIVNYYAGVSSQLPEFDNETQPCSYYFVEQSAVFDIARLEVSQVKMLYRDFRNCNIKC